MKSSKSTFILLIIFFYSLPITIWCFYIYTLVPISLNWSIILSALIIITLGSAALITFYPQKEFITKYIQLDNEVSQKALLLEEISKYQTELNAEKNKKENQLEELNQLKEQNLQLEKKEQEIKIQLIEQEKNLNKKISHGEQIIYQLEKDNREKMQAYKQLENQIQDLRYELKTVLNLAETDYPHPFKNKTESSLVAHLEKFNHQLPITEEKQAEALLKRCLNMSQEMLGSLSSRFLNVDPLILEMRRLADLLNTEKGALILLYHPKQEKVFFVNQELKQYLNYQEDDFCNHFNQILGKDLTIWQQQLNETTLTNQPLFFSLSFKNGLEEIKTYNSVIAEIKTGIFRYFVIAIFY